MSSFNKGYAESAQEGPLVGRQRSSSRKQTRPKKLSLLELNASSGRERGGSTRKQMRPFKKPVKFKRGLMCVARRDKICATKSPSRNNIQKLPLLQFPGSS